ncbi:AAA domain-containing protein [Mycoplasma sp. VS410B]|uniref:DEAD/DEAH box helicase n=2 Tax=unclassified Mycoplasma TaxID=2683645 RepID=UPI003AB0C4A8
MNNKYKLLFKLEISKKILENNQENIAKKEEIKKLLNDNIPKTVKIFTINKLKSINIKTGYDRDVISDLKNIKIIFKFSDSDFYVLRGNINFNWKFKKGESNIPFIFYVFDISKIIISDFSLIRGVEAEAYFVTSENEAEEFLNNKAENLLFVDNEKSFKTLEDISREEWFESDVSQFDDFLDLFNYYKELFSRINNADSMKIDNINKNLIFIPINNINAFDEKIKKMIISNSNAVYDTNGILKGYKSSEKNFINPIKDILSIPNIYYYELHISQKEINKTSIEKKINRIGLENIFLSNYKELDNNIFNNKKAINFIVESCSLCDNEKHKNINCTTVIGYTKKEVDLECKYLNLYDLGQKIKIDTMSESIKLLKRGGSTEAFPILEYILGSENTKMPDNSWNIDENSLIYSKYIKQLNESQRKAFLMSIDGSPVSLIKGPPGTGKTFVINAIVEYITKELREKVVISSQTHIAIDNVLEKLFYNSDPIIPKRITNRKNLYDGDYLDKILAKTFPKLLEKNLSNNTLDKEYINIIEDYLDIKFDGDHEFIFSKEFSTDDFSVLGVTTTSSAITGKKGYETLEGYDWLIIDEVSKSPITEVIRYLPYVKKIILVGDDYQLAPILEINKNDVEKLDIYEEDKFEELRHMYENSVFTKTLKKAEEANRLVMLDTNYRSRREIFECYSFFYDGNLKMGGYNEKPNKVKFIDNINAQIYSLEKKDAIFINVKGGQQVKENTSRYNQEELEAIKLVLKELIANIVNKSELTISVIFPYAAQIERFQKQNKKLINELKEEFLSFEFDTVDAFQGKESDIVLVSTVVTDLNSKTFLSDFRRINVAMSRAKEKLIIFGNSFTLSKIEMQKPNDITGTKKRYFKNIINNLIKNEAVIDFEKERIDE